MNDWQPVFKDERQHRAEIVKSVLKDADIAAVVVNKKDSAYGFGILEVRVQPDDILRAIKIVKEDIKFE